eukprot:TRINITY_DN37348_c0_g1_i2.p1 TRINITY_DN37348_c0_g1~~TRINITY_DN37348_c0_g1_i2.p1  ORF type:complete len:334 (-),score=32.05 TRINITY_DN37348_c0_g1_i2:354-1355(-)
MLLQSGLHLATYTKDMRVGTLVLAVAVTMIPHVGPSDISEDADVLGIVSKPLSLVFICMSCLAMVYAMAAVALKCVSSNSATLFTYAVIGGTGTVLNTSISKLLLQALPKSVKGALTMMYAILAVVCIGSSVKANSSLRDPSLFVPISNGVNLVLNCLAGLCIWGDGQRLQDPWNYSMSYVLVILGTYLLSSLHLFGADPSENLYKQFSIARLYTREPSKATLMMRHMLSKHYSEKFSDRLHIDPFCKEIESQQALRAWVSSEFDDSRAKNDAVVEVILRLMQEVDGKSNGRKPPDAEQGIETWLEEHVRAHGERSPFYKPPPVLLVESAQAA